MITEATVSYPDAFIQRKGGVRLLGTISPEGFKRREGFPPSIPPASVLHDEYVERRKGELADGSYTPGTLLPVHLDQGSLRQLFTGPERKIPTGTPIDWYNPTHPFFDHGDWIMAVRLEPRDSELSSVGFMKLDPSGKFSFDDTRPIIKMAQDPSVTFDNKGHPILNVVRIHASGGMVTDFDTEQFRGPDVRHMEAVKTMPGKDNRPVQLKNGEASLVRGWFRPQGKVGGLGKLAFRDYTDWDAYNRDKRPLTEADLLTTNFQDTDHGGPNFPLPDGQVYGHIAHKEYGRDGKISMLHYYATWMLTDLRTGQLLHQEDPVTGSLTPLIKVVADRSDFPAYEEIPDKNTKTHDVLFTAGIKKLPNGEIRLTAGISDTRAGIKPIANPMRNVDMSHLVLVA